MDKPLVCSHHSVGDPMTFVSRLLFVLSIAPHAVVFLVRFTQLNLKAYNHSLPHI